ncbi:unnamed protein product [Durusdinium trenchii]|uniref:Uncharacterized protein n=1 Tax=Durusdinium trenchii TaxID=1381693 RepID=A0ABP0K7B0_9DINO
MEERVNEPWVAIILLVLPSFPKKESVIRAETCKLCRHFLGRMQGPSLSKDLLSCTQRFPLAQERTVQYQCLSDDLWELGSPSIGQKPEVFTPGGLRSSD